MTAFAIRAARFWDNYFRNQFVRLRRSAEGYEAAVYQDRNRAYGPLGSILAFPTETVTISREGLRAYEYRADPRFTLIAAPPADIGQAARMVAEKTYPYRDPAPFGKQRMAELFLLLAARHAIDPAASPTLGQYEDALARLAAGGDPGVSQPAAALAWFLGERRERSSADALLAVIRGSAVIPGSSGAMNVTAANAAFTALWKINNKLKCQEYLALFRAATDIGRVKTAALFERLLSAGTLLSDAELEADYLRADYWEAELARTAKFQIADWDLFDSGALFWELRYLAAKRLSRTETRALTTLASDEVPIVAAEAEAKLRSAT